MIRTYLLHKDELEQIGYGEEILSRQRREKIGKLKREDARELSLCAELLLIYGLRTQQADIPLPLDLETDEHGKPCLRDRSWHFNLSHTRDFAICSVSDQPVGVDIESFKVRDILYPDKILHPEEAKLLAYISNPNEKKKYFFECWVSKESYLKNLGIGLIVRPSDFKVSEDELMIRDTVITEPKGSHKRIQIPAGSSKEGKDTTLQDNLAYLEKRYVHVFEPGEIRGTDWKFDANYRAAVCSPKKDPDHVARQIHARDLEGVI